MITTHHAYVRDSPRYLTTCGAILAYRGEYHLPGSLFVVSVYYCPACKLVIERCRKHVLNAYHFDPATSPIRPVPEVSRAR